MISSIGCPNAQILSHDKALILALQFMTSILYCERLECRAVVMVIFILIASNRHSGILHTTDVIGGQNEYAAVYNTMQ